MVWLVVGIPVYTWQLGIQRLSEGRIEIPCLYLERELQKKHCESDVDGISNNYGL